ncbi:MAG: endopeptidase La [Clostridia bacterium]|nr:endopeptidase La [Clostridia bacterium]MBQ9714761.1 endopeptidase La [Clostridia bacterium]
MENTTQKEIRTTNLLPIVPLRGKVAFPHTNVSFEVGRDMTLKAIDRASTTDRTVLILTQRETEKDEISTDDVYTVGCVAKIKQVAQLTGGVIRVLCEGLYRAKTRGVHFDAENGYLYAVCDPIDSIRGDEVLEEAYLRTAKALVKDVFSSDGKIPKDIAGKLERCQDADEYVDVALSNMRVRLEVKQTILEEPRVIERLKRFEQCLNDELEISKIEKKIANAVRQNIDKNQKEYFLREQLKAIHTELGDDDKEEDELREKILAKGLPQDLEEKCLKEVNRLGKMPSSSAEYTVITGYLEQVLALPWTEETQDTERLEDCVAVLDKDHYGLEKIKRRITEYLAVLKLTGSMKAPILCFIGPPGVGKTSIAQSIARALNRKFVRMSLGGVKDEAEIRGHRRTYIGAMPGRILYGMKNAGSINPVFLLDEIDKITADMHGDPASALLEVLDPEQNATFRDRYLEAPYDLSKVMFITTANSLDTIPGPLRDRMEIIELSGYTMEEKTEIARRYLVPKQLAANGLTDNNATFTVEGIRAAIEGYTREAGVRTLERTVGSLCRKIAVQYANDKTLPLVTVTEEKVKELLGAQRYKKDEEKTEGEIGAVTGLAWTAVGGTTLTVEATAMRGKGEIKLTGKLGDVMKESALAALSYLRAHAEKYGIPTEKFSETDLHIHVPEGATPKDGPSAGITIATAILSVLTERKARGDMAMTGEITLRGKVLPIGGLKEKALAARRLGIETVIIPHGNAVEIEELPEVLKKDVRFVPVKYVDEVFALALENREACDKTENKPKTVKKSHSSKVVPPMESPRRESVRC